MAAMTGFADRRDQTAGQRQPEQDRHDRWWMHLGFSAPVYACGVIVAILLVTLPGARDYVGADNDDVMRLVQVRDLLAGQGWFDLTQYRLGLDGGTLMHWSRFVDLPIAALIAFFGLFLETRQAEVAALLVWPLFLCFPLFLAMGLAGRRLGGVTAMHITLGFTAFFVYSSNRFLPGSIDHHNLQLVLTAVIAAMLIDPDRRPASYAIAAVALSFAIAIGAETTPFVAVACFCVVCQWVWHGVSFARAAMAFGYSLAISISALFFLTVPPDSFSVVTCDSLSLGFYGLTALGGVLLVLSSSLASNRSRNARLAVVGVDGVVILACAFVLAPQCIGSPLASLDPMLKELWLSAVTEAQSFMAQLSHDPGSIGGFYAAGLFAMAVCATRIVLKDRLEPHAILLALLAVSWGVGLIQLRGTVFSNLLAILPLALLISELRRNSNAEPENMGAGFFYVVATLASVPMVWALSGALVTQGVSGLTEQLKPNIKGVEEDRGMDCTSEQAMAQLAALPVGVVASPSNTGAFVLRFTPHRALSAPYHRNQGGMLTELHIGLAEPDEAEAFLRGAGVTVIAFCKSDPQTKRLISLKQEGLYAALARGEVPPYLESVPSSSETSGLRLFQVRP